MPPPSPSAEPLPLYTRDDTPPPPPTPSTVAPDLEGPQPGVHPGPRWYYNYHIDGLAFLLMVPNGDKGEEPATFIQIETNHGEPQLLGMLGLGCPITSVPLHAKPD